MNIREEIKRQLQIEKVKGLRFKKTARCAKKMYGYSTDHAYFILCGISEIQKFYLKRAYEAYNLLLGKISDSIKLNPPIRKFEIENELYVVYELYEDTVADEKWNADIFLLKYYQRTAETMLINEKNLELILKEFLDAWPSKYHEEIRKLPSFELWKKEIKKNEEILVCTEHGDFASNNVGLRKNGDRYLFDLEFVKKSQPLGLDLYEWHRITDKNFHSVPYLELNILKFQLITEINQLIDQCEKPQIRLMEKQEQDVYFEIVKDEAIIIKGSFYKRELLINLKDVSLTEWELLVLVDFIFVKLRIDKLKIVGSSNNYKDALVLDENRLYCGTIHRIETLPKIGDYFSRLLHKDEK